MRIGIVGAGLAGRLAALECVQRGWQVDLFDRGERHGQHSCGWTAAGMLAPYTELESSELLLCQLGLDSLSLWPNILKQLHQSVEFHLDGTLVVAHPQDASELTRFEKILIHRSKVNNTENFLQIATRSLLEKLAPGLSPSLRQGFWLPHEGHLNNIEFFQATTEKLAQCVNWYENTVIQAAKPYEIQLSDRTLKYDLVIDCRGLAAKQDMSGLRGVRGELIWLETADVTLHCPIRILHPRYPIYIVPRSDATFVVGATMIESEDLSPISAQSMLELLSAAYTVHSGFAEARIIKTLTHCRPTFADQQPKIFQQPGLLSINGLYRHGYMVGPAVVQDALRLFELGKNAMHYPALIGESEEQVSCKLS